MHYDECHMGVNNTLTMSMDWVALTDDSVACDDNSFVGFINLH